MSSLKNWVVGATLLALTAGVCLAQGGASLSEQKKAQNKLLAYRAARVDAIRKLAERIKGLHITSQTYVKDFVAENDQINTALDAFLTGVRETGEPKYADDGTCSLTMEVPLETVITTLKSMYSAYYKGDKIKINDFSEMTQTNDVKMLTETGNGAPRPEFTQNDAAAVPAGADVNSAEYLSGAAKAYWMAHVTGQGRLMAVRAARVEGMRKLAERIGGIQIASETLVRDFVAESDKIQGVTQFFLQGAREGAIRYHENELIVEVEMEVTLQTVVANIRSYTEAHLKGDRVKLKQLDEYSQTVKNQVIREVGMGVPPEKYLKDVQMTQVTAAVQQFEKWPPLIRAVGHAAMDTENENKVQAKLMAIRAAELDARRKLAEELDGLHITSNTTVRDFVAQSDDIRTSMMTFQQGGKVVEGSEKVASDGTVEVTVEINPQPLMDSIMYFQRTMKISIK
jgi:hypothetical protein